jgi:hypothetical protein
VVLIYDIDEIIEMERDLDDLVAKKKKTLTRYKFDRKNTVIRLVDKEIQALEHVIHHIERDYLESNKNFVGKAYVSFNTESMKAKVLEHNQHGFFERVVSYFQKGMTPNLNESELQWNGHKLFVAQAPEPNAVDWEFIHVPTLEKYVARGKSWLQTIFTEVVCFAVVFLINMRVAAEVD